MKRAKLLQGLRSVFPQFRDKSTVIEYYCSYDVPKKQANLLKLWSDVLKFVNSFFGTLVLSQKELAQMFELYGLKPLPIKNILKALHQSKQVYSLSDVCKVYGNDKTMQAESPSKGFFGNVLGYFYQPAKPEVELDDLVFFKEVIDQKLLESYLPLRETFKNTRIHEQQYVLEKLRTSLHLSQDASLILDILELQRKICRVEYSTPHRVYRLVIYPGDGMEVNTNIIELQKVRFGLKIRLGQINHKIQEVYPQIKELGLKAKQCYVQGDKNISKNFLREKALQEKYLAGLIDRRQIINKNLHQLEENQMNQNLLPSIQASQQLIKQNLVDLNTLEDIKLNNEDIKFNLEQADAIYKEVANANTEEEDELYKQIQRQMLQEKQLSQTKSTLITVPQCQSLFDPQKNVFSQLRSTDKGMELQ